MSTFGGALQRLSAFREDQKRRKNIEDLKAAVAVRQRLGRPARAPQSASAPTTATTASREPVNPFREVLRSNPTTVPNSGLSVDQRQAIARLGRIVDNRRAGSGSIVDQNQRSLDRLQRLQSSARQQVGLAQSAGVEVDPRLARVAETGGPALADRGVRDARTQLHRAIDDRLGRAPITGIRDRTLLTPEQRAQTDEFVNLVRQTGSMQEAQRLMRQRGQLASFTDTRQPVLPSDQRIDESEQMLAALARERQQLADAELQGRVRQMEGISDDERLAAIAAELERELSERELALGREALGSQERIAQTQAGAQEAVARSQGQAAIEQQRLANQGSLGVARIQGETERDVADIEAQILRSQMERERMDSMRNESGLMPQEQAMLDEVSATLDLVRSAGTRGGGLANPDHLRSAINTTMDTLIRIREENPQVFPIARQQALSELTEELNALSTTFASNPITRTGNLIFEDILGFGARSQSREVVREGIARIQRLQ